MKVTMNVECTPEEARSFFGLPDLSPVHKAYTDKLSKVMGEGLSGADVEGLTKQWGKGLEQWQTLMWQAATSAAMPNAATASAATAASKAKK